jgi:hypothetical protein
MRLAAALIEPVAAMASSRSAFPGPMAIAAPSSEQAGFEALFNRPNRIPRLLFDC